MTSPLKAELAGIQATLDASLQREREANERIATLTAERDALTPAGDLWRRIQGECGVANPAALPGFYVALEHRVAALKADLSARMSQLNEARAATVDCNMALADANERAETLQRALDGLLAAALRGQK